MTDYEARFKKAMAETLKAYMVLDRIDERYVEIRLFLKQFAEVPEHLRYLLVK